MAGQLNHRRGNAPAAGTNFVLPPQQRLAGQPGEPWTLFFCDAFGNPIEVKGFAWVERLFAARHATKATNGLCANEGDQRLLAAAGRHRARRAHH